MSGEEDIHNTQEEQSGQDASCTGSTEKNDNEMTEEFPMGISDDIAMI